MALPKHKISKSRRDKRRTHWKLSSPTLMDCPNCHHPKLPHRACPNCGQYNRREVFFPKE
ncbi:50S ribosomal protein L32 [candidate division KSB1 bacterium]